MLEESIYNIKCIIEYDGANYQGFQIQNDEPTIELYLKKAISFIIKSDVKFMPQEELTRVFMLRVRLLILILAFILSQVALCMR